MFSPLHPEMKCCTVQHAESHHPVGTVSMHSTVRTVLPGGYFFLRSTLRGYKARVPAKSQSMGSSLIDNLLEENGKASSIKKIAWAAAGQNDIIVC